MPSTITRPKRNRRSRRLAGEQRPQEKPVPILITTAVPLGAVLTLTFNQAVSLQGTPAITTDVVAADVVSAAQTAPNVVAITYDAAILAATRVNIPFNDPSIRNASGGYLTSNVFPI